MCGYCSNRRWSVGGTSYHLSNMPPAKRKPKLTFPNFEEEAAVHTTPPAAALLAWKEEPKLVFTNFNEAENKAPPSAVPATEKKWKALTSVKYPRRTIFSVSCPRRLPRPLPRFFPPVL